MTGLPEERAIALFQAGRYAEAEAECRRLLDAAPPRAGTLHLLGLILCRTSRLDEGMVQLDRAIALESRNPEFLHNRARIFSEIGRTEEALRDLRSAVRLAPRFYAAWLHLGSILRGVGRLEEALAAFRKAIALDPRLAAAHIGLGNVWLEKGDVASARAAYESALALDPRDAMAHYNFGRLELAVGDLARAEVRFRAALASQPNHDLALINLGLVLNRQGRVEDALRSFERAVEANERNADAWNNLGVALRSAGRLQEAESAYARALALRPGFADPIFALGQFALARHDFERGWPAFERRFDLNEPASVPRAFAIPRALPGELRPGLRLALWSEMGIGDQVLYSTLLPELVALGVDAVVEIDPRLVDAYRRSLPDLRFTTPAEAEAAFEGCERQLPIGSLPLHFRSAATSFGRQPRALLVADSARTVAIKQALGPGHTIAIAWRTFQDRAEVATIKSAPLETFARLALATDRLLDLQYGDTAEELAAFEVRHPGVLYRIEGLDARNDLESVLAALEASDLVITTSNATAHFAGALGKRTWLVYLAAMPPFPYWAPRADGRSIWYPSVEIVSEASWRDWPTAFEALALRLAAERGLAAPAG